MYLALRSYMLEPNVWSFEILQMHVVHRGFYWSVTYFSFFKLSPEKGLSIYCMTNPGRFKQHLSAWDQLAT